MESKEKKSVMATVFVVVAFLIIANFAVTGMRENHREEAALREDRGRQELVGKEADHGGPEAAGSPSETGSGNRGDGGSGNGGENRSETGGKNTAGSSSAGNGKNAGGSGTTAGGEGSADSVTPSSVIPQAQMIVAGGGTGTNSGGADSGSQVTEVRLTGTATQMLQAETLQLVPTILPESASNEPLVFRSSDEVIARVTQTGLVTSLRGGDVVISASAPNGITCEYPITVSSTQAHMILQITTEYPSDSDGTGDWQFRYWINGSRVFGDEEYIVTLGDVYAFVTSAKTSDGRSTGEVEGSFTIEESGVEGGFSAVQEFIVEDTRPDHAGESTSFTVTYRFLRAVE